ncbi:MAG: hypothetical protein Fur006_69600 [Coleofasciculaceae cyanobacterium]
MRQEWTDKIRKFCLKHKLPPSARYLWEWLLERQKPTRDYIEFDLKAFNRHIEKWRGQPYDPKTLKRAALALEQCGAITDQAPGRFQWNWRRWVLHPVKKLLEPIQKPGKKCPDLDTNAEKQPSIPQSEKNEYIQQQEDPIRHKAEVLALCQAYGLNFDPECNAFKEVLTHTINDIGLALEYVLGKASRKKVASPQGYLLETLRHEWQYEKFGTPLGVMGYNLPEFIYVPIEEPP